LDAPYAVVAWDAGKVSLSYLRSLRKAERAVTFGDSLKFLGYRALAEGEAITLGSEFVVDTVWEVTRGPIEETISFYAHLRDSEGSLVATGDGLGVPPVQWLPGDWLVQRHPLTVDQAQVVPCCEMWVGVYDYATGARWAASDAAQLMDDGLPLGVWQLTDDELASEQ
jgi:hypothetical protein